MFCHICVKENKIYLRYLCSGKVRLAVTAGNVSCKKKKHLKLRLCCFVLEELILGGNSGKCILKLVKKKSKKNYISKFGGNKKKMFFFKTICR